MFDDKLNKFKECVCAVILCAAVITIVFYPAVFQGKIIYLEYGAGSDSLDLNIPRRYLAVQSLTKYGEFPLWEPKICCGAPLFAESEAGVLHPALLFFFQDNTTLAANLTILSASYIDRHAEQLRVLPMPGFIPDSLRRSGGSIRSGPHYAVRHPSTEYHARHSMDTGMPGYNPFNDQSLSKTLLVYAGACLDVAASRQPF